eukprot:m.437896 g.437896  ORF g.437896 m.437896 type:complete len:189 (+) comp18174_c0_seq1:42-608(+)
MWSIVAAAVAGAVAMPAERGILRAPNAEIIGPAVKFKLEWDFSGSTDLDVCISAPNLNASVYIAIGFSGPKVPKQGMMDSDIVWAYPTADGKGAIETMYSNQSAGYPGATPTLSISQPSFSLSDGTMKACFTRPLKSGHNPIANGQAVIWAIGPLADGKPTYHGADGHDPTGQTQTHRSDEVPAMKWT